MEKITHTEVKIGSYYWASLGRLSLPQTIAVGKPQVAVKERVKVVGIEDDKIVVQSTNSMRPIITVKVDCVEQ